MKGVPQRPMQLLAISRKMNGNPGRIAGLGDGQGFLFRADEHGAAGSNERGHVYVVTLYKGEPFAVRRQAIVGGPFACVVGLNLLAV